MSEHRIAPRYAGYLLIGVERADASTCSAHLLELSRTGGVLAVPVDLPAGERIALHLSVDRAYEQKYGVPEILRFEAEVVDPAKSELGNARQCSFRFPSDVLEKYWPWLDSIATEHGMRRVTSAPPPPAAPGPVPAQPTPPPAQPESRRRGLFRRR